MGGTTVDEALLRARTERLAISQTEIGLTIRASAAPRSEADVDPAVLPRITLDTRDAVSIPPDRAARADLAIVSTIGEGGMGLWICAVTLLAGCVVMRFWKEETALVFTATSFLDLLVGAVILRHVRAGD